MAAAFVAIAASNAGAGPQADLRVSPSISHSGYAGDLAGDEPARFTLLRVNSDGNTEALWDSAEDFCPAGARPHFRKGAYTVVLGENPDNGLPFDDLAHSAEVFIQVEHMKNNCRGVLETYEPEPLNQTLFSHWSGSSFEAVGLARTFSVLDELGSPIYTLALPYDRGSNGQVLSSDGNGNTYWADPPTGGGGGIPIPVQDNEFTGYNTFHRMIQAQEGIAIGADGHIEADNSHGVTYEIDPLYFNCTNSNITIKGNDSFGIISKPAGLSGPSNSFRKCKFLFQRPYAGTPVCVLQHQANQYDMNIYDRTYPAMIEVRSDGFTIKTDWDSDEPLTWAYMCFGVRDDPI